MNEQHRIVVGVDGFTVREGNAAQILLETAEDADLLVVGSRGREGGQP